MLESLCSHSSQILGALQFLCFQNIRRLQLRKLMKLSIYFFNLFFKNSDIFHHILRESQVNVTGNSFDPIQILVL